MDLSKTLMKALVDEIVLVVERMKATSNPFEKVYYLSAASGQITRIVNLQYNPELVFINFVLSSAHAQISARVKSVAHGEDQPLSIPPGLFDQIENNLLNLAKNIEDGKTTYNELENISNLAYIATGNGYYLFLKGKLKIS